MHMKLHVWKTVGGLLFCLGASALASAGCSSSSTSGTATVTITTPANCNPDTSVDCSGGGDPFSCTSGDNPEAEESGLSCSTPTPDPTSGLDDFCCFSFTVGSATTCTADDELATACDADSYGYQCASSSDDPTSLDSSLNCSGGVPDPDGTDTDFCCALGSGGSSSGGSTIPGCDSDSSLDCSGGGEGISCPSGTTPDDSAGICSVPQPSSDGTTDGFCCITITDTGCSQDDSVTGGCDYPAYGFSCTSGSPDPSTDDSSLSCSTAVTDPTTGNDDYCCTN